LKLFRWDNLRMVALEPEKVDVQELMGICHQIFAVQTVVGVAGFVPAALTHSLGLETVGNVVIPAWGFRSTRAVDPECYHVIRVAALYWLFGLVFGVLRCAYNLDVVAVPKVFLKTTISVIQWIAFGRMWRLLQDERMKKARFYLNVVILNKREVIDTGVKTKTGWGSKVGTRGLGKMAAALANKVVTDDKFSKKIGANMETNIPEKMALMGIKASAKLMFTRGNLLVMQVVVESIDVRKLVGNRLDDKKADKLNMWLEYLPPRFRREIDDFMKARLAVGLMQKLPENMAGQLRELAGIEVEVESAAPDQEAECLFELLAQLDQQSEAQEVPEDAPGDAAAASKRS